MIQLPRAPMRRGLEDPRPRCERSDIGGSAPPAKKGEPGGGFALLVCAAAFLLAMIVVAGASGYVGRLVAGALARRDVAMRLLSRDPARIDPPRRAETVRAKEVIFSSVTC